MRLFLVRHGQTVANVSGVLYGSTDLALSPHGIGQSRRVAGYLSDITFSRAITSQLRRARQTAHLIDPTGSPDVDPRLNELDFGEWEMRHFSDIAREYPAAWQRWMGDWQHAAPQGGEAFPHFASRVTEAADAIRHQQAKNDTLIVAHQGVLSLLLASWLGLPAQAMWHFPFRHDAYTVVEINAAFITLRIFNGTSIFRPEE